MCWASSPPRAAVGGQSNGTAGNGTCGQDRFGRNVAMARHSKPEHSADRQRHGRHRATLLVVVAFFRVINEQTIAGNPALEPIAEFPGFSFVLGDLHPHVLALPFAFPQHRDGAGMVFAVRTPHTAQANGRKTGRRTACLHGDDPRRSFVPQHVGCVDSPVCRRGAFARPAGVTMDAGPHVNWRRASVSVPCWLSAR